MVIITGWIAVPRGEMIVNFNLEKNYLELKTNSTIGSNDEVYLMFCNSEEETVGALHIYFHSTPQYRIGFCNLGKSNFLTVLPSATDKVWRVTLTRTSGIRLALRCNEVEVLNNLISGSTCGRSVWSTYWSRKVAKILFPNKDSATDFYRAQSGKWVIQDPKFKIPRYMLVVISACEHDV